eukprot:8128_1
MELEGWMLPYRCGAEILEDEPNKVRYLALDKKKLKPGQYRIFSAGKGCSIYGYYPEYDNKILKWNIKIIDLYDFIMIGFVAATTPDIAAPYRFKYSDTIAYCNYDGNLFVDGQRSPYGDPFGKNDIVSIIYDGYESTLTFQQTFGNGYTGSGRGSIKIKKERSRNLRRNGITKTYDTVDIPHLDWGLCVYLRAAGDCVELLSFEVNKRRRNEDDEKEKELVLQQREIELNERELKLQEEQRILQEQLRENELKLEEEKKRQDEELERQRQDLQKKQRDLELREQRIMQWQDDQVEEDKEDVQEGQLGQIVGEQLQESSENGTGCKRNFVCAACLVLLIAFIISVVLVIGYWRDVMIVVVVVV